MTDAPKTIWRVKPWTPSQHQHGLVTWPIQEQAGPDATQYTRTDSIPSPDALICAALEAAAEKAKNKLEQKQLFKEAQSVSDAIRALKDDLAAIKAKAEGRG